jgi:hypothetical protein
MRLVVEAPRSDVSLEPRIFVMPSSGFVYISFGATSNFLSIYFAELP